MWFSRLLRWWWLLLLYFVLQPKVITYYLLKIYEYHRLCVNCNSGKTRLRYVTPWRAPGCVIGRCVTHWQRLCSQQKLEYEPGCIKQLCSSHRHSPIFSLSDWTADVIQRCLLPDGFVTLPHLLFLIEPTQRSLFMQLYESKSNIFTWYLCACKYCTTTVLISRKQTATILCSSVFSRHITSYLCYNIKGHQSNFDQFPVLSSYDTLNYLCQVTHSFITLALPFNRWVWNSQHLRSHCDWNV